jgi:hypothetical protein
MAGVYTALNDWSTSGSYTKQTWTFDSATAFTAAQYGQGNVLNGNQATLSIDTTKATWSETKTDFVNGTTPYTGIWTINGTYDGTNKTADEVVGTFTIPTFAVPSTGEAALKLTAVVQTNDANFSNHLHTKVFRYGDTASTDVTSPGSDWTKKDISATTTSAVYEIMLPYMDMAGMGDTVAVQITRENMNIGYFAAFDSISISTVPEPGTVAMLIAGSVALLGWAGRRWFRK